MDSQINFDHIRACHHMKKLWNQKDLKYKFLPSPSKTVDEFLDQCISALLKTPASIPVIACSCEPILPELLARITDKLDQDEEIYPSVLRVLGVLVSVSPCALDFAEHVLHKYSYTHLYAENDSKYSELLIFYTAIYRILLEDCQRFSKYISLKLFAAARTTEKSRNHSLTPVLSYITAMILNKSDYLANELHSGESQDARYNVYENVEDIDYTFFPLLEAKRITDLRLFMRQNLLKFNSSEAFHCHLFHSNVVNIGGVLLPMFSDSIKNKPNAGYFIPTENSLKSVSSIASAMSSNMPVLLRGAPGSGRTFYIEEIARSFGRLDDLVRIHLGDQTDSKMLLGTYSTGKSPGSFEWKPGVLTTAVQKGRWVLIEDIDKAPTDILSVLLSLLEKRTLQISARADTISAHHNFRVFATMRVEANDYHRELIGQRLWKSVSICSLSDSDLFKIIVGKFPVLTNLCPLFIRAWKKLSSTMSETELLRLVPKNHLRSPSTRDLIKWAKRVNCMLLSKGVRCADEEIPSEIYDFIFADAIDCFAGYIPSKEARGFVITELGRSLDVPPSRIELVLSHHVPKFQDSGKFVEIGRGVASKTIVNATKKRLGFARTGHSLRLLEQLTVATSMAEPLLLVGETGTGKTTVIQYLAKLLGKKLISINLSQQTEASDLLGGYKPVDNVMMATPLKEEFDYLFDMTFPANKNERFLVLLNTCFAKQQWANTIKIWKQAHKMARNALLPNSGDNPKKKRKVTVEAQQMLLDQWDAFLDEVSQFEAQTKHDNNSFLFNFVEGLLVKAVKRGDWVLLDEINLASSDTLECISDLIVENPRLSLQEKSGSEIIKVNSNFRLFGCMNPSTDVGKRDIPTGLRSRFTELYVTSPDGDISDLLAIIDMSIKSLSVADEWIGNDIAQLYLQAKQLAEQNKIVDGAGQMPHYSVRTLSRILQYSVAIYPIYGLRRALYEGACMCFLTLLDKQSENLLHPIIASYTIGKLKNMNSIISQIPSAPQDGHEYVQFKHYWLSKGQFEPQNQSNYIITPSVEKNLLNLTRATAGRLFPVLIQGPTSSGKTSMINYLAKISGHKFVRINNHEHTDLQEYLGTYVADEKGKLKFQEGALVTAIRNGYWVVLDELNLAPTDVLEALNRLLDDNRELLIPETQEIVKPHPEFMLFATQNPPGLYGGRKVLSRAFRNRFLELHFDDIPENELETILRERCLIAPSYAKKMVDTYRQLALLRQTNRVFEQKHSFATLRDLFRWAQRDAVGYEQLALNGYMLLGERVRNVEERQMVKETIEKVMKVKLDISEEYDKLIHSAGFSLGQSLVWTKGMRRLLVLVKEALRANEPVLLVGETGSGKTTICQLLAEQVCKQLYIVNAHQNTETGDLIGSQRPVRDRGNIQNKITELIKKVLQDLKQENGLTSDGENNFSALLSLYRRAADEFEIDESTKDEIEKLIDRLNVLFEWTDGSLVKALKHGDFFLLDEISLADDSVLERLNSVLEPERTIFLSEKGSTDGQVSAKDGFQFFATMNPGGDYGKKELSPALRNRFTEIWVPSMEDFDDVLQIVESRLDKEIDEKFAKAIVNFSRWFGSTYGGGDVTSGIISLRDILSWVSFVNNSWRKISLPLAVFHGGCMVFIDSIGSNASAFLARSENLLLEHRRTCIGKLSELLGTDFESNYFEKRTPIIDDKFLTIGAFSLVRKQVNEISKFNLSAPTTARNAELVVRAMQMHRPVLLEGSPGVGKTSLISALAEITGNPLTRINLSEQTDLIDLFGSDTPAENEEAGQFTWKDAPFLRAMQQGEWVLLDEMNLASQSVLEGLNACLDHRGEAYIPELDQSFKCHPNFLVFAAQNPQYQGGGRKGLPKSFLNRFSVVYVDSLDMNDLQLVGKLLHPNINEEDIRRLTEFIAALEEEVSVKGTFGQTGSPFEFNLRDISRWLSLFSAANENPGLSYEKARFSDFFDSIIAERFRTVEDRSHARKLFENYFGHIERKDLIHDIHEGYFQIGDILVKRNADEGSIYNKCQNLQCNYAPLKSIVTAIEHSWPTIIVGPSSSGKTELIRYVANLYGAKLDEMPMNQDMDSTDLLGGFEQADISEKFSEIKMVIKNWMNKYSSNIMTGSSDSHLIPFVKLHDVFRQDKMLEESDLRIILETIEENKNSVTKEIAHLSTEIVQAVDGLNKSQKVRFKWCDGTLIKAIEQGHWLVLDNANLCSPSVLDRLNSLLEPNGCLMVNECSLSNGKPRIVKPHPNFRLFLTVNPKYGELSRAMRNRGLELYLESLETRATAFDRLCLRTSEQTSSQSDVEPVSAIVPFSSNLSFFARLLDASLVCSSSLSNTVQALLRFFPSFLIDQFDDFLLNFSRAELIDPSWLKVLKSLKCELDIHKSSTYRKIIGISMSLTEESLTDIKKNFDFQNCQAMDLLVNTAFSRSMTMISMHAAHELIEIFSRLNRVKTRVDQVMDDMNPQETYFEMSAAKTAGLPVKYQPLNVCEIVTELLAFAKVWMDTATETTRLIPDRNVSSVLDLLRICEDFLLASDVNEINETELHVYIQILSQWLNERPSDICPYVFGGAFADKTDLKSAKRMEEIWQAYRVSYPLSKSTWDLYLALNDLAKRFDDICFNFYEDSFESTKQLRNAIIMGINNCRSNKNTENLEGFVRKLEAGISDLEKRCSTTSGSRKHLFTEAFKSLALLIELRLTSENTDMSTLEQLSAYSELSTAHLSNYGMLDGRNRVYPPVLDTVFRDDPEGAIFFENSLSSNLLVTLTKYQSIESDTLQIASKDLKNLSGYLLNEWEVASCEPIAASQNLITSVLKNRVKSCKISDDFYFQSDSLGGRICLSAAQIFNDFLPDYVYDPALQEHVIYERAMRLKQQLSDDSVALNQVLPVFYGDDRPYLSLYMASEAESIDASPPHTYRPAKISIKPLYNEMKSFTEAYLNPEKIESLLRGSKEQISQWQTVTSRFITSLNSKFLYFKDITDIATGFVLTMKFGMALHLNNLEKDVNSWCADPIILGNPRLFLEKVGSLKVSESKEHLHLLKSVLLNIRSCSSDRMISAFSNLMTSEFRYLYYKWSFAKADEEEKAAAQTTIYRDNTEHDTKIEMMKLFPDYEEVVDPEEKIKKDDDTSVELMDIYIQIFSVDSSVSTSSIIDQGVDVLSSFPSFKGAGAALLSSIIVKLVTSLKKYSQFEDSSTNFYHDSNPYETGRVVGLVEDIRNDIISLVNRWPDHYTLFNINIACSELLKYPVNTPLAKYLQKIEQILTFLVEWETYASKEVSLQNRVQEVTDLIISWRKLELSTWPHLFDYEDENVKRAFSKWWYYLYENLIHNVCQLTNTSDVDLTEIVKLLSVLMSNGTFGDFSLRLVLLKSFSAHAAILADDYPQMIKVSNAIANVHEFYSQFESRISSLFDQKKKPLIKDLHEVMQLARWKDTNINALKNSSRRSHDKLYKIVRKYRTLVNEPISDIVNSADQSLDLKASVGLPAFRYEDHSSIAGQLEFGKSLSVWSLRSSTLANVESIGQKMRSISDDLLNSEMISFEDLATSCMEEAERLRKETPAKLTEETKKIISSLKMEKSELLIFAIKQLRQSGMKTTVKKEILIKQSQTSSILAKIHFVNCGNGNSFYWRILEMLPRLRSTIANSDSDVSVQDLQRGLAIGENLVNYLISKRENIWSFQSTAAELKKLIDGIQVVCGSWDFGSSIVLEADYIDQLDDMTLILNRLPDIIDHCMKIIDVANFVKNNLGGYLIDAFEELKKRISDYKVKFDHLIKSQSSGIITEEWKDFYEQVRADISSFILISNDVKLTQDECLALEVLSLWVKTLDWHNDNTEQKRNSDLTAVDNQVNSLVENLAKSLLVIYQGIAKANDEIIDTEDENWFIKAHNSLVLMTKNLHMDEILISIKNVISNITNASVYDVVATKHSLVLLATALPFLTEYANLIRIIEQRLLNDFFINSRSAYILLSTLYRLSTEGFCGPNEQSEEMDSNAVKDGTGLGDGSGAKTNNEDVEEDEDLLENAQTKNEDQNEEDGDDDDDDAVSIEGDMDGNLEDLKEDHDENEENDREDEDDENENIDDEVGNIDELDPNQMDEKMWDEQGDSGKEKQTEKDVGSAEDDLQAGEEDTEVKEGENEEIDDQGDDEKGDEDEDVDMQEDNIEQSNVEDLENHVPESEILDIEDDLKLENENEDEIEENDDNDNEIDAEMENDMDDDEVKENETEMSESVEMDDVVDAKEEEEQENTPENGEEDQKTTPEEHSADNEEPQSELNADEKHFAEDNVNNEAVGTETSGDADKETELGTTSKEETSVEGSGETENNASESQENNGGAKGTDTSAENHDQPPSDDMKNDLEDMVQKLGDAMQEYYRRNQEISKASEQSENAEESANVKPDEFQHVDDEKYADAQTLGDSMNENKQQLDDEMEIDEEEEHIKQESQTEDQLNDIEADGDIHGSNTFGSSLIGERKEEKSTISNELESKNEVDDEMDLDSQVTALTLDKDLPVRSLDEARDLWKKFENNTQTLALSLCEQLRLILEPTQATKLRGDFKTGKRLNMKRIIPYIASQYKKDKIWLRRTKPSKRNYQIMISVDNSKSMAESNAVDLAFQTIAMISKALTQLEAGELAIERFGEDTRLLHPFNKPFSGEDGSELLRWFGFNEEKTDMKKLLTKSLDLFAQARNNSRSESWQLQVIISDGVCEDHEALRRLVRRASEEKIIIMFVVIDGINIGGSIFDMNQVQYDADSAGNMTLIMKKYLDTFPFDYYIIIRDVRELPIVMSSVLRQFFSQSGDL